MRQVKTWEELTRVSAQFSIPRYLVYQRLQLILVLCISYFSKYLTEAASTRKHLLWLIL